MGNFDEALRSTMPNYDWKCEVCHHTFEHMAPNAVVRIPCPRCGARVKMQPTAVRQPSAPAFRLVGSGFHKNDYPSKDK